MSRYIDADALMSSYARLEFCSDMRDAMEILDNAPSIDIVPCGECKWRDDYGCHNPIWGDGWANYPPPSPRDDDFCSYGEREGE